MLLRTSRCLSFHMFVANASGTKQWQQDSKLFRGLHQAQDNTQSA
jgi:hypothetical protein